MIPDLREKTLTRSFCSVKKISPHCFQNLFYFRGLSIVINFLCESFLSCTEYESHFQNIKNQTQLNSPKKHTLYTKS